MNKHALYALAVVNTMKKKKGHQDQRDRWTREAAILGKEDRRGETREQ